MKKILIVVTLVLTVFLASCSRKDVLYIATTTSLDNSGLLAFIIPDFEEKYDCEVNIVALGTGAALEQGRLGSVDILLVHAYDLEVEFVAEGYGEKRANIMYNDFIFVGATALTASNITEALNLVYETPLEFYSRGDNSGTHVFELDLWEDNDYDVDTFGDWYNSVGSGMGTTLVMTDLASGITLTDRGTYYSMKAELPNLSIIYENREELKNQYGVIKVTEENTNGDALLADLFYDWIQSSEVQEKIGTYIMYEETLFYPNAGE